MSSGRIEPVVDQRGRGGARQLQRFGFVPFSNRPRRSPITEEGRSRRQALVKTGLARGYERRRLSGLDAMACKAPKGKGCSFLVGD
jgi:hypothetical protein